jgi:two-component system sensor histidine kinase CpxA
VNSLFTRTLLWFIATVILTFIAMVVAATLGVDPGDQRRSPFGTLIRLQLNEARYAYESGGPDALRLALERFRRSTENQGVLTDAQGKDLATGMIRRDLLEAARQQRGSGAWRRERTVVARRSEDGRYFYVLLLQRGNMVRWFLQPEVHLTVLGLLTVLSYAFARHLTNPVRKLQTAVECFGRGELDSRVRSKRKDEIGQLARTFDRMADRIETLLEAERRLLLDISHELRSPLARLSLAVELARSGEDVPRHLDRIDREADRLNGLVGGLLQVTRAEGDQSQMRRETVELDVLLQAVVDDAQIEAEQRGCRVELVRREPVVMQGDTELLRRAVENVVRNGVRYTEPGTAVLVSLTRSGSQAVIEVRDHGPGVPEEHLKRIFDPFYRVDSDRNRVTGGAGLGLAIARRAIELHQGSIRGENTVPGLRITMQIPV